jgi:hypothetical protein
MKHLPLASVLALSVLSTPVVSQDKPGEASPPARCSSPR